MPKPKTPTTRKMGYNDPEYPTNIVGQSVESAYRVFWESQKIGRVWRDGVAWNWSLHDIASDRTMGTVIVGGGAKTKAEAVECLMDADKRLKAGKLEGLRPPMPVTVEIRTDG